MADQPVVTFPGRVPAEGEPKPVARRRAELLERCSAIRNLATAIKRSIDCEECASTADLEVEGMGLRVAEALEVIRVLAAASFAELGAPENYADLAAL